MTQSQRNYALLLKKMPGDVREILLKKQLEERIRLKHMVSLESVIYKIVRETKRENADD